MSFICNEAYLFVLLLLFFFNINTTCLKRSYLFIEAESKLKKNTTRGRDRNVLHPCYWSIYFWRRDRLLKGAARGTQCLFSRAVVYWFLFLFCWALYRQADFCTKILLSSVFFLFKPNFVKKDGFSLVVVRAAERLVRLRGAPQRLLEQHQSKVSTLFSVIWF